MENNMAVAALGVAVKLQNLQYQSSNKGILDQGKQDRLEKVVSVLLEFMPEEETMIWMTGKNERFRNIAPMDLVESEYATKYLLDVVEKMRSLKKPFQRGDRVVWPETGKTGTVRVQFSDGYVSLMFDNGCPAELEAVSLRKMDMAAK